DEIRRHGEETYPHECCGILIGTSDRDTSVVKSTMLAGNILDDRPQDRFNIDPADTIRAQKLARQRIQDIVGFYHSHPDCPAQWSQTDLAEAHWIGCSYVITSVREGKS